MKELRASLVILMLLLTGYSTVSLAQENSPSETSDHTDIEYFTGCYIEASGEIDFTWQLNDIPVGLRYRYISFWPIVFNEPNVDVTLCTKKNGDVLWEDSFESGQWVLYLVNFIGLYNNDGSSSDTLIANLDGRVTLVVISTKGEDGYEALNQAIERSSCIPDSPKGIPLLNSGGRYRNCYLKISGYMHHDWPAVVKLPNMVQKLWLYQPDTAQVRFGVYSYILFEDDASIMVYDTKDGTLLWQHEGILDPLLTLVGFSGEFVIDASPHSLPYITVEGRVQFLGIVLHDFPEP